MISMIEIGQGRRNLEAIHGVFWEGVAPQGISWGGQGHILVIFGHLVNVLFCHSSKNII